MKRKKITRKASNKKKSQRRNERKEKEVFLVVLHDIEYKTSYNQNVFFKYE